MISDGAMGSELIGQGIAPSAVMHANLEAEATVRSIHEAYIAAGAQFLTSNTFGLCSNSRWIDECRAGLNIAQKTAMASHQEIGVWMSLPPSVMIAEREALDEIVVSDTRNPPFILIETCTSLIEARKALKAATSLRSGIVAITGHFRADGTMADGTMPDGTTPEEFVRALEGDGAQVLGANCGETPEPFDELTSRMRAVTRAPLLIQSSAGLPKQDDLGIWRYPVGPDRFAKAARQLADAGASIIGGCCGTSAAHIAAAKSQIGCFG